MVTPGVVREGTTSRSGIIERLLARISNNHEMPLVWNRNRRQCADLLQVRQRDIRAEDPTAGGTPSPQPVAARRPAARCPPRGGGPPRGGLPKPVMMRCSQH